ncbi:MAG: hypothetical protein A2504_14330 [Bdellovibrionales bacterium RIFOXYD12_FULL_39_22]|nr:MAG: hypothetical protein A2385_04765 [Bdellovibrionales bacterium RIFOXYB1_FULL_39_21]OFZ43460.1 MAG: hypothetical protein A2485_13280 [Bdellovibrionales bacterium RIFOXYC12_FULL_39_17]OFZ47003.1 MAG: hypothetical protein A2404_00340 [Bdellovibrionales bacterium RIFOXYC1_FULL_39_130]OFZ71367.1 MAG: hypothetical protein A2451_16305 [Bdellovibrionales bacterium RIFOXYC2_FULL_39_8]OFZ76200.1 MAG: hypothetical protein A2560_07590 [Bdellovibrionales bacterium RIFOXYD1_FULL_39_84]OFZ94435.1 MAG:
MSTPGYRDDVSVATDGDKVSLDSLAQLTGFPASYIKKELLIDGNEISVEKLRSFAFDFLNSTMGRPS